MNTNVLDTNVILDQPFEATLESFTEPSLIVLPLVVLEELDTFKKGHEARHEYARMATRFLDGLRADGKLHQGVPYKNHIIKVHINIEELDLNKPDYKIIKTAKELNSVLVTQDINVRVVADALDVECKGFTKSSVDVNSLYTGQTQLDIDEEQVNDFINKQRTFIEDKLAFNQFVSLKDEMGGVHEGIYKGGIVEPLHRTYNAFSIKPKTKDGQVVMEQKRLMHLLLDPSVQFVSAIGPSGCGKTVLALAAALEQTINKDLYNRIVVMRPLVAAGDDIGFLPGTKLEKLEPWMASTFDALEFLLEDYTPQNMNPMVGTKEKIYGMIQVGELELEAIAHIRGRSIPNQFIIIDDAQNLTPAQATTIITRAAEGTKVIFLGDLSDKQIDNHRLTPSTNGLAYTIDRMKDDELVGHITLTEVVRSPLAQLAVERM